jgi:hypothetical protein
MFILSLNTTGQNVVLKDIFNQVNITKPAEKNKSIYVTTNNHLKKSFLMDIV